MGSKKRGLEAEVVRRQREARRAVPRPQEPAPAAFVPRDGGSTEPLFAPAPTLRRVSTLAGKREAAIERLLAAQDVYDRASRQRGAEMLRALQAGCSPATVGRAMGISRQAVNQRVERLAGALV